jgi:hypothetical protein
MEPRAGKQTDELYESEAKLAVEEALAVQALVMQVVRPSARRAVRKEGMHRFVFYESAGPEAMVGSDETERFIAVSAGRKDFRSWTMRVSFLELMLSKERQYSNYREMYRFDWDADGNCTAVKQVTDIHGVITDFRKVGETTVVDESGEARVVSDYAPNVETEPSTMSFPVEATDCDQLSNRLLEVVNTRKARNAA